MNRVSQLVRLGLAAAMAAGLASAASAAHAGQNCFFISQWQGSKAADDHTLYLGVNLHDVYKVEVTGGAAELQGPDMHLVSIVRGGDSICSPLDLDLSISDGHGFRTPLIARTLTKLTPQEIAAIPAKFRP
jgi:hypothetical protein